MENPYLSEIRIFGFSYAPKGWAQCNGQMLPVNSNQALFALLGTAYGGDGVNNFALPNLQGAVPMHVSSGQAVGQKGGEQNHTLLIQEMPAHTHTPVASSNAPNVGDPTNNFWPGAPDFSPYGPPSNSQMSPQALGNNGSSQPHNNMAPYLVVNICIALQGIFPTRN